MGVSYLADGHAATSFGGGVGVGFVLIVVLFLLFGRRR
jgi:hypothetical protein